MDPKTSLNEAAAAAHPTVSAAQRNPERLQKIVAAAADLKRFDSSDLTSAAFDRYAATKVGAITPALQKEEQAWIRANSSEDGPRRFADSYLRDLSLEGPIDRRQAAPAAGTPAQVLASELKRTGFVDHAEGDAAQMLKAAARGLVDVRDNARGADGGWGRTVFLDPKDILAAAQGDREALGQHDLARVVRDTGREQSVSAPLPRDVAQSWVNSLGGQPGQSSGWHTLKELSESENTQLDRLYNKLSAHGLSRVDAAQVLDRAQREESAVLDAPGVAMRLSPGQVRELANTEKPFELDAFAKDRASARDSVSAGGRPAAPQSPVPTAERSLAR